jgi:hypothetical protein
MAIPSHSEFRRIAWNGVAITLPSSWQAKVTALQQLNFENNAQALMEMRWQQSSSRDVRKHIVTLTGQYHELSGKELKPTDIPVPCRDLFHHFEIQCFSEKKQSQPVLIFLYSPDASLFIMLRFYSRKTGEHALSFIKSLDLPSKNDSYFDWSIQDFTVRVPLEYHLNSYSMRSGFTVLQFSRGKTVLTLCRLAFADKRLGEQNFEEIFSSLLGEDKPVAPEYISKTQIRYTKSPGIIRQLGLRFQRKKPFRLATLWHDQENDRFLGVFMEDIKPMNEEEFDMICRHYEIFQN